MNTVILVLLLCAVTDITDAVVCDLILPNNPLTADGLQTPYLLTPPTCIQSDVQFSRWVHAVIVNKDTGELSIYNPVVTTQFVPLAATPVPVTLPANYDMIIYIGSNANNVTLANPTGIANGLCTSGPAGSPFGQYAYCNGVSFWKTVNALIAAKKIVPPAPQTAIDGMPCPLLRDFFIIDQDPSDGVITTYLITKQGRMMQNNQVNQNNNKENIAGTIGNDGDNRLLNAFIQPAAKCAPWTVPDLSDPGQMSPSNVLNIIQSMAFTTGAMALLPADDPMTTTNKTPDLNKINLYKLSVNELPLNTIADASTKTFCMNYATLAPPRFKSLKATDFVNQPSPMPPQKLWDFMRARASTTYTMLNCAALTGMADPFAVL